MYLNNYSSILQRVSFSTKKMRRRGKHYQAVSLESILPYDEYLRGFTQVQVGVEISRFGKHKEITSYKKNVFSCKLP